jgi:hypothetical protein
VSCNNAHTGRLGANRRGGERPRGRNTNWRVGTRWPKRGFLSGVDEPVGAPMEGTSRRHMTAPRMRPFETGSSDGVSSRRRRHETMSSGLARGQVVTRELATAHSGRVCRKQPIGGPMAQGLRAGCMASAMHQTCGKTSNARPVTVKAQEGAGEANDPLPRTRRGHRDGPPPISPDTSPHEPLRTRLALGHRLQVL